MYDQPIINFASDICVEKFIGQYSIKNQVTDFIECFLFLLKFHASIGNEITQQVENTCAIMDTNFFGNTQGDAYFLVF